MALRDPAPPAYGLLRGFGGAAGRVALTKEIPVAKTAKKRRTASRAATSKKRSNIRKSDKNANPQRVRSGTKQSSAIEMLRSPGGATIAALAKTNRWQSHSVRGFLTGVVRKRLNLHLESAVVDGVRTYRVTGKSGATPVDTRPRRSKS